MQIIYSKAVMFLSFTIEEKVTHLNYSDSRFSKRFYPLLAYILLLLISNGELLEKFVWNLHFIGKKGKVCQGWRVETMK